MKSAEIRSRFLSFFADHDHQVVASSALVPHGDPTLLFTNAGMNQFKDVFLGLDKRSYQRAATAQKCVRAGGKHNDLENVGYTARHHTFFEMLGNFSFGDYFKRDAIHFCWQLLTDVFALPKEKLLVTVYAEDDEAFAIWRDEIGVPAERIIRIGDKGEQRYISDNFWMMGETGPCGPCSEVFYDHGEHIAGGPPGSAEEDGDRFIEIWNLVFMQFNRDEDGTMHPLPRPSVDTGMGLERIAAVLQGVHSNYEIDIFQALIAAAARETGCADRDSASLRVLADHIRACAFLIADGVIPGNEGRGFVLRRIIRRAVRHGYKLGARKAFFYRLVPDLVAEMGAAYPQLEKDQQRIAATLQQEEERFFVTLEHGMGVLEAELDALQAAGKRLFNGETAFRLHDTYGFPLDLTADVCRERDINVDEAAFDAAMQRQKALARAAGKFKMAALLDYQGESTRFHGYDKLALEQARILALYREGSAVEELLEGDSGVVVLDQTPFYAEAGGQVGDIGLLRTEEGIFSVEDTQKIQAAVFGHHGVVSTGHLRVGATVAARVDLAARQATMRNHSVTHIMHKALREVLGEHVQQKGSLVDAEKTRFDFTHGEPMRAEQIAQVEQLVNDEVFANEAVDAELMPLEAAQNSGAVMLFGEKYDDEVRVLSIGSSKELCGGTHVQRTGDIGLFKIVSEGGVAAGVRRVEAVTAANTLHYLQALESRENHVSALLKARPEELAARIGALLDNARSQEREITRLKERLAQRQGDDIAAGAIDLGQLKVLAAEIEGADAATLRSTLDQLKNRLGAAAIVLASVRDNKVSLIAGVTAAETAVLKAGELVNFVARQVGGKGGGRADMAQAGGTQPEALPAALQSVSAWVQEKIA